MNQLLILCVVAILIGLLVGCLVESRRRRSYEEYRRQHLERKAEVERNARGRL
ncbi:hypothetical protein D3C85_1647930 [compost metagenome]